MAKKARRTKAKRKVVPWTRAMVVELRKHSKLKTRLADLEKVFKRGGSAIRQKAFGLGLQLGHTKRRKKKR
jgi:hypothetical protein